MNHPRLAPALAGDRRVPLTRDQIAKAAAWLADTGGLEAVTMRAVAAALDVSATAIYRHLHDREELLGAMADQALEEALVPRPTFAATCAEGWRAAVTCVAQWTWTALQAHPWVVRVQEGARLGPNGLRHAEQLLAALATADLGARARVASMHLVDDYVLGHVARSGDAVLVSPHREAGQPGYQAWLRRQLSAVEHPQLVAVLGATRCGLPAAWARTFPEGPDHRRFARGLAILLDGLQAQISRP